MARTVGSLRAGSRITDYIPVFPQLRTLAESGADRCRTAVASPPECALGGGPTLRRWLLSQSYLSLHLGPPEPAQPHRGPRDRVSSEGCAGSGAHLSPDDHDSGSPVGPGPRIGGALSRAMGNGDDSGRTEDPSAGCPDRPAQQDCGTGPAGVLWAPHGPLCPSRSTVLGPAPSVPHHSAE